MQGRSPYSSVTVLLLRQVLGVLLWLWWVSPAMSPPVASPIMLPVPKTAAAHRAAAGPRHSLPTPPSPAASHSGPPATMPVDLVQAEIRRSEFDRVAAALDDSSPAAVTAQQQEWSTVGPHDWGAVNYMRARQEFGSNPQACAGHPIVAVEPRLGGLMTTLASLGHCMSYTLARQMTFVVDESEGRIGTGHATGAAAQGMTMRDWMEPISTCAERKEWAGLPLTRHLARPAHGSEP
jgi:hypothetical protein